MCNCIISNNGKNWLSGVLTISSVAVERPKIACSFWREERF